MKCSGDVRTNGCVWGHGTVGGECVLVAGVCTRISVDVWIKIILAQIRKSVMVGLRGRGMRAHEGSVERVRAFSGVNVKS